MKVFIKWKMTFACNDSILGADTFSKVDKYVNQSVNVLEMSSKVLVEDNESRTAITLWEQKRCRPEHRVKTMTYQGSPIESRHFGGRWRWLEPNDWQNINMHIWLVNDNLLFVDIDGNENVFFCEGIFRFKPLAHLIYMSCSANFQQGVEVVVKNKKMTHIILL